MGYKRAKTDERCHGRSRLDLGYQDIFGGAAVKAQSSAMKLEQAG